MPGPRKINVQFDLSDIVFLVVVLSIAVLLINSNGGGGGHRDRVHPEYADQSEHFHDLLRRGAVIARNGDLNSGGNRGAMQTFNLLHDVFGHRHGVLAFALAREPSEGIPFPSCAVCFTTRLVGRRPFQL